MQSTMSRRALSVLAAKIHPPVPLSPRESQQLLNLLTTSFRAHLDREHPVSIPKGSNNARLARSQLADEAREAASPAHPASSYSSASEHIDSILSNPLFARKPRRRGSDPAAVDVLKDPLNWFLDQIATGAADIPKAAMCLEVVPKVREAKPLLGKDGRRPATVIAEWLQSSGLDTSKEFVDMLNLQKGSHRRLIDTLVPMLLLAENDQAPLWRWLIRLPEQRMQETGLDASRIHAFRTQLLVDMVSGVQTSNLDDALDIFIRAHQMVQGGEHGLTHKVLQPAGARLVKQIMANTHPTGSPELYETFLLSTSSWLGAWSTVVQPMLWLYHPTKPTASPGLSFIQDPKGAVLHVASKRSRQQFLVQLCLGVARQLLEEKRLLDAQVAMEFTREHFAELVLSKTLSTPRHATSRAKTQKEKVKDKEKENLEILNRLVLT